MKKAIIGKKIGMTQIFDEVGNVIPVTIIEAGPCVVAQKKTVETDGYSSVQLGFEDIADKKLSKAVKGHFAKANVAAKRNGATVSGPSPLPTEKEIITILRAVHKYKDSREQFEYRTHKRLIDVIKPSQKTIEALTALELPAGVEIEIKL